MYIQYHFAKKNLNKLIVAHLNINSLRNKFEFLIQQTEGKIDILIISETKLDESFPVGQFLIKGVSTPFDQTEIAMEVLFVCISEEI